MWGRRRHRRAGRGGRTCRRAPRASVAHRASREPGTSRRSRRRGAAGRDRPAPRPETRRRDRGRDRRRHRRSDRRVQGRAAAVAPRRAARALPRRIGDEVRSPLVALARNANVGARSPSRSFAARRSRSRGRSPDSPRPRSRLDRPARARRARSHEQARLDPAAPHARRRDRDRRRVRARRRIASSTGWRRRAPRSALVAPAADRRSRSLLVAPLERRLALASHQPRGGDAPTHRSDGRRDHGLVRQDDDEAVRPSPASAARRRVVASPASFNNAAGLSRAITEQLAPGTEVFIAEMGTYGAGEIAALLRVDQAHRRRHHRDRTGAPRADEIARRASSRRSPRSSSASTPRCSTSTPTASPSSPTPTASRASVSSRAVAPTQAHERPSTCASCGKDGRLTDRRRATVGVRHRDDAAQPSNLACAIAIAARARRAVGRDRRLVSRRCLTPSIARRSPSPPRACTSSTTPSARTRRAPSRRSRCSPSPATVDGAARRRDARDGRARRRAIRTRTSASRQRRVARRGRHRRHRSDEPTRAARRA